MASGGKRSGAGRPKGRRSDKTLEFDKKARALIAKYKAKDTDLTSLDLFRAIYRSDDMPTTVRMAAAEKALPYEHPKLAAIEHTGKDGAPLIPVLNVTIGGNQPQPSPEAGTRTPNRRD